MTHGMTFLLRREGVGSGIGVEWDILRLTPCLSAWYHEPPANQILEVTLLGPHSFSFLLTVFLKIKLYAIYYKSF